MVITLIYLLQKIEQFSSSLLYNIFIQIFKAKSIKTLAKIMKNVNKTTEVRRMLT